MVLFYAMTRRPAKAEEIGDEASSVQRVWWWRRRRSRATRAAFCGFYVSGADAQLTNNATQVVLMRDGTRTVLSMQNNYQGPPQDFAMVVPVPVVLQKENVKTLDASGLRPRRPLTAPRLVEYWEQDPCPRPSARRARGRRDGPARGMAMPAPRLGADGAAAPVKIEAQFSVGEYDIVVLSATDSTALDTWLHQNGYKIPDGAEPYLRPVRADGDEVLRRQGRRRRR